MISKTEFQNNENKRKMEEESRLYMLLPPLERYIDGKLSDGITKIYFTDISMEYKHNKDYFLKCLKEKYCPGGWNVDFLKEVQKKRSSFEEYYFDKIPYFPYSVEYTTTIVGFHFK